jgi:hypothetical protein
MINKEDELRIVCLFDESKIIGSVSLDYLKQVIFDFVQVGPMYSALHDLLLKEHPELFPS